MNSKDTNIRISGKAFQRLKTQKANTGASIKFMIDLALDCWLGKEENDNPSVKAPKRNK